MNQVKDYYETACLYLSLSSAAKFFVSIHFQLVRDNALIFEDIDNLDEEVFTEIGKRDILSEFTRFATNYKRNQDYERHVQ